MSREGKGNGMDMTIAGGYPLNDGYRIPRMAFGTYHLEPGGECEEAVAFAIEDGYRLIDCARFYANEAAVGAGIAEGLRRAGIPRQELFVVSKVWNDRQIDGTVRESIEESLRDLGLDYLDLMMIHWPVEGRYLDTWKVLEQVRDEGLVRSIGVANCRVSHLERLMAESGTVPAVDQMEHSPYMQDEDTRSFCGAHGIVYEAWSPLGRGSCLEDPVITGIAQAHGATPGQVILEWERGKGIIPLPRSRNKGRIHANAQELAEPLTLLEVMAIDALDRKQPVNPQSTPETFAEHLNSKSSHF